MEQGQETPTTDSPTAEPVEENNASPTASSPVLEENKEAPTTGSPSIDSVEEKEPLLLPVFLNTITFLPEIRILKWILKKKVILRVPQPNLC